MKWFCFFAGMLLACSTYAAKEYGNVIVSRVGTVIDGDSFKVDIDSWPEIVGKGITVRIGGIDTPEMRGKCDEEKLLARKAKQFTVEALRSAQVVELRNIKRGKYFRIIADVYLDGRSLSEKLMKSWLARVYQPIKSRKSWCN